METATAAKTELSLAEQSVGDIMLNSPLLAQIDQMALRMAKGRATVPKHLQDNEGDCWAIIMQAIQWKMNPFVVAQKTHVVSGTLGYEAQLVLAVVESSGAIDGHFHYQYQGEGNSLECRVGAKLKGDKDITWNEWLCIASVKVKNSPLWTTNPKQQLGYLQGKNFCRAYAPGAILGIYTPDELQEIPASEREVGPGAKVSSIMDEIKPKAAAPTDDEADDAEIIDPDPDPVQQADSPTYAEIAEALNKADSPESFAEAREILLQFDGPEDQKKELGDLYRKRLKELQGE